MTISGRRIAKNTALNLSGYAVPLVVGVASLPVIIDGLGTARFGLLGIAWAILGYFNVLDLGMSRAATRFAADAIGRDAEDTIPGIVWSAATVQVVLGLILGGGLFFVGPLLSHSVLKMPDTILFEARATFRIVALAVPIVMLSASFRGVLEARQRFGLIVAVSAPASTANFIIPAIGALLGWSLIPIVGLLVVGRAVTMATFFAMAARITPGLRGWPSLDRQAMRAIIPFGAWTSLSNILSPIMDGLDRVLLGAFVGVGAAGYYTTAQEIIFRLRIAPASLSTTLFPAFSSIDAASGREHTAALYARSVRYLILSLGPVVLALVMLAPDIMAVWLGEEFARESSPALRILAVGFFINSIAFLPFAFLTGINRPDLPARFHLLEFPIFLALAWIMMPRWGATGAAIVWTIRVALDSALLLTAAHRTGAASGRAWAFWRPVIAVLAAGVALALTFPLAPAGTVGRFGLAVASALAFGAISLVALLTRAERRSLTEWLKQALPR